MVILCYSNVVFHVDVADDGDMKKTRIGMTMIVLELLGSSPTPPCVRYVLSSQRGPGPIPLLGI